MLASGVSYGINPKRVADVMLVVRVRMKSSAVSVSGKLEAAGWDNAPSSPSGFPVLKRNGSAQTGVAGQLPTATVATARLSSAGPPRMRISRRLVRDAGHLAIVHERFIRVSSRVQRCREV